MIPVPRLRLYPAVGPCLFLLLFLSATGAWADELLLLHPRLYAPNGGTLRGASVLTFDTETPGPAISELPIPLTVPMGLAVDAEGRAYVGEVSTLPLRVELLRFTPGEAASRSFDAVVDSSIRGFINFIGVDLALRGDDLYFLHGKEFDINLEPVEPTRLVRLGLETGATEVVWESFDDLSGLAVDERGNVFVGVLAYDPLTVEVVQIRPDRTRRSLGRVFDSSGAFTLGRPFELAAAGGSVYIIHPRIFDAEGNTLVRESIRRLDVDSGGSPVELLSVDESLEGIAADRDGQVFYGRVTYDPFRLELRSWSAEGEASYGTVIDSAGTLLDRVKVHLAVRPDPPSGTCRPNDETLCFQDGRFEVTGTWTTADGSSGPVRAADVGRQDSAALYFFTPQNLEILIKLLDACNLGNYWLFYSATTDVGFELRVRDTVTGSERIYSNPIGTDAEPVLDTRAFTCGE